MLECNQNGEEKKGMVVISASVVWFVLRSIIFSVKCLAGSQELKMFVNPESFAYFS